MTDLKFIVARGPNDEIGYKGDLPWKRACKEDLKRFKALTLGGTVLMGRKTAESLPFALPGRTNLVLTRDSSWSREGFTVTNLEALEGFEELWVIGGSEVYNLMLQGTYGTPVELYITTVEGEYEADTYLPLDLSVWKLAVSEWPQTPNQPKQRFDRYTYKGEGDVE